MMMMMMKTDEQKKNGLAVSHVSTRYEDVL